MPMVGPKSARPSPACSPTRHGDTRPGSLSRAPEAPPLSSSDVFADSAYRSAEIEAKLEAGGFKSRIHRRASRNHPLSDAQTRANRGKSKIRARIEHVFGAQQSSAARGPDRAHHRHRAGARQERPAELSYNMRRLVTLERMAAARGRSLSAAPDRQI